MNTFNKDNIPIILGCILPLDTHDKVFMFGSGSTYNSTRDFLCKKPYTSSSFNNTMITITCDGDRRWDYIPYCWTEGKSLLSYIIFQNYNQKPLFFFIKNK